MTKDKVLIRGATKADIEMFYEGKLTKTVRAWVAELDGEVVAVVGVIREPTVMVAFSSVKKGLEVGKMTIWKTALRFWDNIKALGYPVRAIAHPEIPGSAAFLERLGFFHVKSSPIGEVYQWTRQQQ